jgi:hypothetical protein
VSKDKNKDDGCLRTEPETEQEPVPVFLLLRLAKLAFYYHLHSKLLPALFSQTVGQLGAEDVSRARATLLLRPSSLDARAAVVRSYVALACICESLALVDGVNVLLSLVCVLAGLAGAWRLACPRREPPAAACGLRSFSSRYWQHLVRRPYKNFRRVVAGWVLLLLPSGSNSAMKGAIVAFVVFFLSGASHAAINWGLGQRVWRCANDVYWFMLNFVVCSLETTLTSAGRRLAARAGREREFAAVEASWLGWLVGYVWTFGFLFWSVPMWRFPMYEQLVEVESWKKLFSNVSMVPENVVA